MRLPLPNNLLSANYVGMFFIVLKYNSIVKMKYSIS